MPSDQQTYQANSTAPGLVDDNDYIEEDGVV